MSLIKDDEFVVIHIDENCAINNICETLSTEYIQMKNFTPVEQELMNTPEEELIDTILDEIIQDVVEEFKKSDTNIITKQPKLQVNRESQTDLTYKDDEQFGSNITMSIHEIQAQEEFEDVLLEEEEPCLRYYKPKRKNPYRRKKLPNNKNDCLSGLKRFLKYIFNF